MAWIALGGALAILVIVALGVRSSRRERAGEAVARAALARTIERGAQPVSLHPSIDLNACIGSGACVEVCPEKDVLAVIDGQAHLVNPSACIGHGECLRACPTDAIRLVIGSERRGVDIPLLGTDFETNVPGLYIAGELGGMGLIYNAMTQGLQCARAVAKAPPPRQDGVLQLLIVGAGPAGLAASLAAREAGLDFATIEQESLGGAVLSYPRHKIVMTRGVELPGYGKLKASEISKEALLEIWKDVAAKTGLAIRTGVRVESLRRGDPGKSPTGGDDGVFEVVCSTGPLRAQRVLLAIGRRGTPRKLGVPGEELPKVCYRLLEPENYAGARVLVVGGGDAGVEAALALASAGATTHLSYRGQTFDRIKPANQQRLDSQVAAGKVTLQMGSVVKAIRPDAVTLETAGQALDLPNDYVLIFAGGELPTKLLATAGVEVRTYKGEAYAPANS